MNSVKRVVFACAAAGLLSVGVPGTAHAEGPLLIKKTPDNTTSPCRYFTVNDVSPGGQLGGPFVYNGAVSIHFVAPVAMLAPQTNVWCELLVNGVSQGTVLSGSGFGVVEAAGQLQFTAAPDDLVGICTYVQYGSGTPTKACVDGVTQAPFLNVDQVVCTVTIAVAPIVDAVVPPNVVWIEPASGDLYILGELVYDCFPYVTP